MKEEKRKDFILVYYIDDYCDNGGGIHVEWFDTSDLLDKRVSEVYPQHGIIDAGHVAHFEYEEVQKVTIVKRKE